MRRALAAALVAVVFAGLAAAWSPARWAPAVAQVGIFALALVWGGMAIPKRVALPSTMVVPVAALALWGAAQLWFGWTVYAWQTSEAVWYWTANALAAAIASSLAAEEDDGSLLLRWLFLGGVALAFVSLIQNFTSDGRAFWIFETPFRDRVYGPFVYKNQYAAFIELLLPVACVGALAGGLGRWRYLVTAAALLACVVAADSRAGLIVSMVEVVAVCGLLAIRGLAAPARLGKAIAMLVALIAVFSAVVGPEAVWTRLQREAVYATRRDLTVASFAMARERPLTGFGLGAWPTAYPKYASEDDGLLANQAHNDWAQALVEGGLPGLACLAAIFLWAAWMAWKRPWALGLAAVLLHALVDYPIQRQAIAVFFFVFAGVVSRSREKVPAFLR